MKHFLFYIPFLLVYGVTMAQENTALDKADASFYDGKFEKALNQYTLLLERFGSGGCDECKLGMAQSLIRLGRLDESIKNSEEIISQSNDQEIIAEAKNLLGEAYMNKGRNDLALELLEEALAIFKTLGSNIEIELAQCYNNLALAHWNAGSKDLALQYQLSVLDIRKRVLGEQDISVGDAYNNLGLFYPSEESDEAATQYDMAHQIYVHNFGDAHPKVVLALNNIAIIHRDNEDYFEALEKFEESLDIWNELYEGDHPNKAFVYLNIGLVYKKQKELSLALEYYGTALDMYKSILK